MERPGYVPESVSLMLSGTQEVLHVPEMLYNWQKHTVAIQVRIRQIPWLPLRLGGISRYRYVKIASVRA